MDILSLRHYVNRRLGSSSLNVEIDDEDINIILEEALGLINRYVPRDRCVLLSAASSQKRYVINHRGLIGVKSVRFMNTSQLTGDISENPFLDTDLTSLTSINDTQNILSSYHLGLAMAEDRRRLFSSDPVWDAAWEFNETTRLNEYALYIDLPDDETAYKVTYEYSYKYEISDDQEAGITTLTPDLESWLRKYVVAACRELLGDIRNKFGGIPLPDGAGSAGPIDGERQIERGREDMRSLEEDLKKMRKQLPPLIG